MAEPLSALALDVLRTIDVCSGCSTDALGNLIGFPMLVRGLVADLWRGGYVRGRSLPVVDPWPAKWIALTLTDDGRAAIGARE